MTWEDARLDTEYDGAPEKAGSTVVLTCIGFLVRKNRKEVVLAMDLDAAAREVRFIFTIPAKMVVSVTDLVPKDATKEPEKQ